jgi:hypothetical protein
MGTPTRQHESKLSAAVCSQQVEMTHMHRQVDISAVVRITTALPRRTSSNVQAVHSLADSAACLPGLWPNTAVLDLLMNRPRTTVVTPVHQGFPHP